MLQPTARRTEISFPLTAEGDEVDNEHRDDEHAERSPHPQLKFHAALLRRAGRRSTKVSPAAFAADATGPTWAGMTMAPVPGYCPSVAGILAVQSEAGHALSVASWLG